MLKQGSAATAAREEMTPLNPWFRSPNCTLYLGDALAVAEQLPAGCADMIFVDPPYKLSNDGVTCHAGKRVSVNKGRWDKSEGFARDTEFHETVDSCLPSPVARIRDDLDQRHLPQYLPVRLSATQNRVSFT